MSGNYISVHVKNKAVAIIVYYKENRDIIYIIIYQLTVLRSHWHMAAFLQ